MNEQLLQLLIDGRGSSADLRAEASRIVGDDADAVRIVDAWLAVERSVSKDLERTLPDRRSLVLAALVDAGRQESLTEKEVLELRESGFDLNASGKRFPALHDAASDIARCAEIFDEEWAAAFSRAQSPRATTTEAELPVPKRRVDHAQKTRQDRTARPLSRDVNRKPGRLARWAVRGTLTSVAVAFAAAVWFFGAPQGDTTLASQAGAVRIVELADGSSVRLIDGASIRFDEPFDRQLRLDGRAFFDVAHGAKAFSVYSEAAVVTVLGTRFGVEATGAATEVTLVEGRVAVASAGDRDQIVVLEPGQQTRVSRDAAPGEAVAVDLFRALDWSELLVFRATAMSEVAQLLQETFDVKIFVHRSLADERVTGTFEESSSARAIISALAATLDARVEVGMDGDFRILPR